MQAGNKTTRKYYKYVEAPLQQPVVVNASGDLADCTLDGEFFTCWGTSDGYHAPQIWKAFAYDPSSTWSFCYGHDGSYGYSYVSIYFYSEMPIKITTFSYTLRNSYFNVPEEGAFYGSNDGIDYEYITSYSIPKNTDTTKVVDMSSNTKAYKYYRWNPTKASSSVTIGGGGQGYYFVVNVITLSGTEMKIVDGTSSDYDFYEDIDTPTGVKRQVREYYKYVDAPWQQYRLAQNGTMGGDMLAVSGTQVAANDVSLAFDQLDTTYWAPVTNANPANSYCDIYNPEKLKVTSITVKNRATANLAVTAGAIYGGDEGSGLAWTTAVQDSNLGSKNWWALAYDGIKFVALGDYGYTSTSTDGTTWAKSVQDSNLGLKTWRSLAYDGTKFVALGLHGYTSTSTDGTTWTTAVQDSNLGDNTWYSLAYGGTKFVALGQYGHTSTSTDGTTWTTAVQDSNLGNHSWSSIAYGGTKFVALGGISGISCYASASTDGITWIPAVQDSNLGNNGWRSLAYDGTKFVALGYYGYISTSTNVNYTLLKAFTNATTAASGVWTIDLSDNTNYYNYYRFLIISGGYSTSTSTSIAEIGLTATQLYPQLSDSSNYDFYKDKEASSFVRSYRKGQYYPLN